MNYDWDDFTINIYLDEDKEWLAHLVKLPNVSAFGDTPELALDKLYLAWERMKQCYRKDEEERLLSPSCKEYSEQCNVKIDENIRSKLVLEATKVGISVNALVAQKLGIDD